MQINEKKHLLLIDDDEDDFLILKDVVETYFEPILVSYFPDSGELNKNVFHGVDLVLLDINMPRLNGFQCLELIRKEYNLIKLPVVMYSNSFAQRDIETAYEKGANLFVNKPVSFEKIRQAIKDIVSIDWTDIDKLTAENYRSFKILKD